jgi:predicted transcriptional regulator
MESSKTLTIPLKKYKGDSLVISVRVPIDLIKRIDQLAEETGRTRNEIITMCLDFALDNTVISNSEEKK